MECPGCGAQRSFVDLIQGNFIESFWLFPALLPLLFTLIYLILHLVFSYKNGAKVITISFATTAVIMMANFIYKQILFFN